MGNTETRRHSEDGPTLKKRAKEGDNEARVAFADQVFYQGYQGTRKLFGTRKAAREKARDDALRFINEAVDDGHFRALRLRADINLHHRKDFHSAEGDYKALLSHPECPDNERGELLLRLGQAMLYQDQIKGHNRKEKALAYLRQALDYEDHQIMARHVLAGVLWKEADYEEAVSHAKSCYQDYPWAAMILHMAYKKGYGVEADTDLAAWYYDYWEKTTQGS